VIDEVLAVGDAEFQKKAIGKMQDISRSGGRTVLFVSHNLLAVKSLCTKGVLMEHGKIIKKGGINEVVDLYLSKSNDIITSSVVIEAESNGFCMHSVTISNNGVDGNFNIEEDVVFDINITSLRIIEAININIFVNTIEGMTIFATCSPAKKQEIGNYNYKCVIPKNTLNDIFYSLDLMVVENGPKILLDIKEVMIIEGIEGIREGAWLDKFPGMIRPQYFKWDKTKIE
jgi:lipopolysaccharide transport system ATP-binding protein